MTNEELCRRIEAEPEPDRRDLLMGEAAGSPGFVSFALQAALAVQTDDQARCIALAEIAAAAADGADDHSSAAMALRLKGQSLRALGRHADVIEALNSAELHAIKANDSLLAAQVQLGSIDSLGMIGRTDEAIDLAAELELTFLRLGRSDEAAKALVNCANLYFRRDKHGYALESYEKALTILRATGDSIAIAKVEANSSNVLVQLNRIDEAMRLLKSARGRFHEAGLSTPVAMIGANEAYLHYISGEHSLALGLFADAMREFRSKGQDLEYAKCELDAGDVYMDLNLLPEALSSFENSAEACARIGLPYEHGRAELGRAKALSKLGRFEEALAAVDAAELQFKNQNNALQLAYVQLVRASIYSDMGEEAPAREHAIAAHKEINGAGMPGWAAEAQFIEIDADLRDGIDRTRAMASVGRTALTFGRPWLQCRVEVALGRWFAQKGRHAVALRHYRSAVDILDVMRARITTEELYSAFLSDKIGVYEVIVDLLMTRGRKGDIVEALSLVERSKSSLLLDKIRSGYPSSAESLPPELLGRISSLRSELARTYHHSNTFGDDAGGGAPERRIGAAEPGELLRLESEYRVALREADVSSIAADGQRAGWDSRPEPFSLTTLEVMLGSESTLIEYYVAAGKVSAFVIGCGSVTAHPNIATVADILHLARRLTYHLSRTELLSGRLPAATTGAAAPVEQVLAQLYAALLRPLGGRLHTKRLVIVPHGILHGLPFHAFTCDGTALVDQYEIVYAPSASIWRECAISESISRDASMGDARPDGMLLMGVPTQQLSHIAEEVDELARSIPHTTAHLGSAATIDAFLRGASNNRWIHLATHGMFRLDNPMFSGLRFADGWMLARDLYGLKLNCRLATLSACRTGSVKVEAGDEMFGIIRGFLIAGVESLVLSLWPAHDQATSMLMRRFYQLLLEGKARADALREAQKAVRAVFPNPYYWAPFVLYGS